MPGLDLSLRKGYICCVKLLLFWVYAVERKISKTLYLFAFVPTVEIHKWMLIDVVIVVCGYIKVVDCGWPLSLMIILEHIIKRLSKV